MPRSVRNVFNVFVNGTISKKLILLVSMTAGAVVMVAFVLSTINDIKSTQHAAKQNLATLADVLAANVASALLFEDKNAASDTLAALKTNVHVLRAEVTTRNDNPFVQHDNIKPENSHWSALIPALNQKLEVIRPITLDNQTIGRIKLYGDAQQVKRGLMIRVVTNLFGVVIAFLMGIFLIKKIVASIFGPIKQLNNAMSEIIDHEHYALRVPKKNNDELGDLTDGFNLMLSQIQYRDTKLRQSDLALSQTQEAIALHDEHFCYQYINPAFSSLFGYEEEALIGKHFTLEPMHSDRFAGPSQSDIFTAAREDGVYRGEVQRQSKDGKLIPVALYVSPIKDANGQLTGYVSVASDITEKKQAEKWMWKQANYDVVTGLPNRHMFYTRLEHEVNVHKRSGDSLALLYLDLDNFKEVNDTLGHDAGDALLKQVGERLVNCTRETDTVGREGNIARLGGDEFTIILSQFKDIKHVDVVAQRILEHLEMPFYLGNETINISASIGITLCPEDASDAETLVKNADQTMYDAKSNGRNTYRYFTRSLQEAVLKRREIINDLRIAISQQQFEIVYQPIVDLSTNKIFKAEALLRWNHPEQGVVSPAEFIPVAEDTGMIVEIGDWVFKQVAQQIALWREVIDENFQVSINKSPVQFDSKSIHQLNWFDYMKNLDIPGSSLVIEITEGLMLTPSQEVTNKLLAFRDAGVQVAVDDFGTGYSSLSYLKKFDVDYIKIDKSFVQNLSIHSEDMVLCEAIIVMAHKLGLKVIAEGVETIEQRDLLFAVGCDYGQGYLFSRPVNAETIQTLCLAQNHLALDAPPAYEQFAKAS